MSYKQPTKYRVKNVGRKDGHYLLVKVYPKKYEGKRGGRTQAELVEYKSHHKKGESPFKEK